MTIDARLKRLVISSPEVERVAKFYVDTFGYQAEMRGDEARCDAAGRSLWIRSGRVNQLLESHFVFADSAALDRYIECLEKRRITFARQDGEGGSSIRIPDPDGRSVCFAVNVESPQVAGNGRTIEAHSARLQHYAVRTPVPQALLDFYSHSLGFTVSDLVRDQDGELTAAFLRSDAEHHSLAIFRATELRFDHFSCETRDWYSLRDWADLMARRSIRLAWGIGRHGPGNDTFFMVLDPDGNLAEISSDLEHCAPDRAVGSWDHRMETLNQWGVAIMRS
jgi:catechol 2,3-dioxygenase-like lactoylglutathione lyase family enzyme